jgi:hypothetical protein
VISVAKGGKTELPNLTLLCPAHHALVTEREFGAAFIAGKLERARAKPRPSANRGGVTARQQP